MIAIHDPDGDSSRIVDEIVDDSMLDDDVLVHAQDCPARVDGPCRCGVEGEE